MGSSESKCEICPILPRTYTNTRAPFAFLGGQRYTNLVITDGEELTPNLDRIAGTEPPDHDYHTYLDTAPESEINAAKACARTCRSTGECNYYSYNNNKCKVYKSWDTVQFGSGISGTLMPPGRNFVGFGQSTPIRTPGISIGQSTSTVKRSGQSGTGSIIVRST